MLNLVYTWHRYNSPGQAGEIKSMYGYKNSAVLTDAGQRNKHTQRDKPHKVIQTHTNTYTEVTIQEL